MDFYRDILDRFYCLKLALFYGAGFDEKISGASAFGQTQIIGGKKKFKNNHPDPSPGIVGDFGHSNLPIYQH